MVRGSSDVVHTTSQPSSDILFINVSAFSCFLSQSTSRILYFFICDPTPFKFFSSYHTLLFSNLKESCLNKTSKSNSYEDGIIHVSPSIITKSRFAGANRSQTLRSVNSEKSVTKHLSTSPSPTSHLPTRHWEPFTCRTRIVSVVYSISRPLIAVGTKVMRA